MTASSDNSGIRGVIIGLIVLLTVCVAAIVITGVTSLISLADRIHPVAGTVVFWIVVLGAAACALYGAIAYAKLPPALIPPEETSGPKHEAYLEALRLRLAANPRTRGTSIKTDEEIEKAISILSIEADTVVRKTASTVFLST